jgi:MarR family transcriptional regulator, organic hydroperoxide resistance regulator
VAANRINGKRPGNTTARERPLGDVLEFLRLLWAINHGLNTTSRRMQTQFGITGQQRLVIRIIDAFPGLSAGELAQVLHIHPSTATGILQRLASRQLVQRRADPGDARRLQLQLTPKGRRLTAPRVGTVEASVRRTLGRFNDGDVKRTRQVLTALSSALGLD